MKGGPLYRQGPLSRSLLKLTIVLMSEYLCTRVLMPHKCVMFDKKGSGSSSILFSVYGRSYKYPLFLTKFP